MPRRGKGGKFVKGKKGRKHHKHKGGVGSTKLLHSMKKQLTRIEHKVNPERLARIRSRKHARLSEAELAAKYG